VWSVAGREFTIATNQVDFAVPKRFGLVYKTRDNTESTPLCIHRAPLGTHERFIAFLIEHYAGNFPLWLAPDQVRVLPMGESQQDTAQKLVAELRGHGVRAEIDISGDKIGGRIRNAETNKVHTILIIGQREQDAGTVAVRLHGKGDQGAKPTSEVVAEILTSIRERRG
jgi:threonyl-tRNA synthetase